MNDCAHINQSCPQILLALFFDFRDDIIARRAESLRPKLRNSHGSVQT